MDQRVTISSIALVLTLFLSGCNIQTVPYVDLERYMGLWYQISANPAFFNDDLVGVTAEYELQEDGSVKVLNKGYVGSLDGPVDSIIGRAEVVDEETNSRLKVTFPEAPNLPYANYLIVLLDEENYQYAVVTDPFQTTLFVLSRTPQMDNELYSEILVELDNQGIKTGNLILTPQADTLEQASIIPNHWDVKYENTFVSNQMFF